MKMFFGMTLFLIMTGNVSSQTPCYLYNTRITVSVGGEVAGVVYQPGVYQPGWYPFAVTPAGPAVQFVPKSYDSVKTPGQKIVACPGVHPFKPVSASTGLPVATPPPKKDDGAKRGGIGAIDPELAAMQKQFAVLQQQLADLGKKIDAAQKKGP